MISKSRFTQQLGKKVWIGILWRLKGWQNTVPLLFVHWGPLFTLAFLLLALLSLSKCMTECGCAWAHTQWTKAPHYVNTCAHCSGQWAQFALSLCYLHSVPDSLLKCAVHPILLTWIWNYLMLFDSVEKCNGFLYINFVFCKFTKFIDEL